MAKHPSVYRDEVNDENLLDPLKPRFTLDSRGALNMPLPGYSRWQLTTKAGSKIVAQGSQDKEGKGELDIATFKAGYIKERLQVGEDSNIVLDAVNNRIHIGKTPMQEGSGSIVIDDIGIKGYNGSTLVFGMFINKYNDNLNRGDFIFGDIDNSNYIQWDASASELKVIGGTITGSTIRTASSGNRVELTTDEYISFYNGSGTEVARMYADAAGGANVNLDALSGNNVIINAVGALNGVYTYANDTLITTVGASGLTVDGYIRITDTDGDGYIDSANQSSNPSTPGSDRVKIYTDGSDNLKFRKSNGDTAYIDLTGGTISTWA